MAYYKARIEVWCDWNPAEGDVEEIAENISAGEASTQHKVVGVVNCPEDIEDDEAIPFLRRSPRAMLTKVRVIFLMFLRSSAMPARATTLVRATRTRSSPATAFRFP